METGAKEAVDVWTLRTPAPGHPLVAAAGADLDAAESARADRFRFDEDRATYVTSHALLRRALARASGVEARSLAFETLENGRPELTTEDFARTGGLRFNLSHTRPAVACALAPRCTVGIDVERVRAQSVAEELAERVLHPVEREAFEAAPPARRRFVFFQIWAMKEAYIKATGEGMRAPLREIAFATERPALVALPAGRSDRWRVAHRFIDAGGDHVVSQAVCWENDGPRSVRWNDSDEAIRLLEHPTPHQMN